MDSCEVVIVGGGPAGSSCAWALRNSGLDVLILDKSSFPRPKVCGGWITPSVLQVLEIESALYSQAHLLQPIEGFALSCMDQEATTVSYGEPVSYGIRRSEFDNFLLRRSGARVRDGVSIAKIERSGEGWIINGEFRARLLIGAGGHFCPVARLLKQEPAVQPIVAQEIEFEMTEEQTARCNLRGEVPELYFCRDMRGYGWCFRKGNFLNVGLGRLDRRQLPEHVHDFTKYLNRLGKIQFDLTHSFLGHAYLSSKQVRPELVADGVMLIGDSAGLAYPESGEGIRPAVESGLLAAEVLRDANGVYTRDRLRPYVQRLRERFSDDNKVLAKISRLVPQQFVAACGRALLKRQSFCRSTIVDKWFLRTQVPDLKSNRVVASFQQSA